MTVPPSPPGSFRRLLQLFGWTRHSSVLLGGFFLICGLIIYVWWPLAQEVMATIDWSGPWWRYFDWLLVGIFAFMTLTIMSRANLRLDALIVFVGMFGGLVIESWGTQTNLWHYYTAERPPIWVIPAWPTVPFFAVDYVSGSVAAAGDAQAASGWGTTRFKVLADVGASVEGFYQAPMAVVVVDRNHVVQLNGEYTRERLTAVLGALP